MPTPPKQFSKELAVYNNSRRRGVEVRNLIQWFVPEKGIIEMYVNPQQISYQYKKNITNQRTKGGYVLQYWGEELTTLTINGTTGSSGVEGVNVLNDVYRNEQIQFDPYALALASDRSKENDEFSFLGDFPSSGLGQALTSFGEGIGETFTNMVANSVETGSPKTTRPVPTLASLAFTVEMFYSNWVFRGYFTDLNIEERADRLGLFDYRMTFMVTQQRGIRPNFLAWHRVPDGPSHTDPILGRPYSYTDLESEQAPPTRRPNEEGGFTLTDMLKKGSSLINEGVGTVFKSIF